MSEMVERVANALRDDIAGPSRQGEPAKGLWLQHARAAIAAMREPTEGMKKRGRTVVSLAIERVNKGLPLPDAFTFSPVEYADDTYIAMIDEALRENDSGPKHQTGK